MTEFARFWVKRFSYLIDDGNGNKKGYNKRKTLRLKTIKNGYKITKLCLDHNEDLKSEAHNVFTEKVNKIVLLFNDNKILQSFNRVK